MPSSSERVLLTLMLDICDEEVVLNDIPGRGTENKFLFDSFLMWQR